MRRRRDVDDLVLVMMMRAPALLLKVPVLALPIILSPWKSNTLVPVRADETSWVTSIQRMPTLLRSGLSLPPGTPAVQPVMPLSGLAVDRGKVVAVDGPGAGGDGAADRDLGVEGQDRGGQEAQLSSRLR